MNKRIKKKKRFQLNRYANVSDRELWNLDHTICEFMIPRLQRFKKINIAYPGRPPMDTPEKWDEALDKMIHAFELAKDDPIDLYDKEFWENRELFNAKVIQYHAEVQEGLHLFADYFFDLWI